MSTQTIAEPGTLVEAVRAACRGTVEAERPAAVARALRAQLAAGVSLRNAPQATKAGYCSTALHIDEELTFTIRVMTWLPGQDTPIHDHTTWCVVGVVQGEEEETRFRLDEGPSGRQLLRVETNVMPPGDVTEHLAGATDIHQVRCTSAVPALSLHVYGALIPEEGSSIGTTYDHLPLVVEGAPTAAG